MAPLLSSKGTAVVGKAMAGRGSLPLIFLSSGDAAPDKGASSRGNTAKQRADDIFPVAAKESRRDRPIVLRLHQRIDLTQRRSTKNLFLTS